MLGFLRLCRGVVVCDRSKRRNIGAGSASLVLVYTTVNIKRRSSRNEYVICIWEEILPFMGNNPFLQNLLLRWILVACSQWSSLCAFITSFTCNAHADSCTIRSAPVYFTHLYDCDLLNLQYSPPYLSKSVTLFLLIDSLIHLLTHCEWNLQSGKPAARRATGRAAGGGGRPGGGSSNILQFYTDDSPGLQVGPTTVLVASLSFVGVVVLLHIWGKFRM